MAEDLPFVIKTPSRDRWLKMLIYGPYGVGKTRLAATAQEVAEMKDVLFIDAEGGTLTIASFTDISVVPISNYSQFARVYEFLRLHVRLRDENNLEKLAALEARFRGISVEELGTPKKYRTVVIDSMTEVQKYCMYQLLGIRVGTAPLDIETPQPEWGEWNKSAEMMRLLIRSFRDLPMHVIFVAAQQQEQDEMKRYHYLPALPGKLANEAQGFVDVVGYLRAAPPSDKADVIARRLFLQPGATFHAKDRYHEDNCVAYIDDPTLAKFMAAGPIKQQQ